MASPTTELTLVLPCHNECEHIEALIRDWNSTIAESVSDYEILVINDGSSDGTGRILDRLRKEMKNLRVIHQLNAGHEISVQRGYELARGHYILQVDANGRYEATPFPAMWAMRQGNPLVLGVRTYRMDSIIRRLCAAFVGRAIRWFFDVQLQDPNIPFRLFERERAVSYVARLASRFQSLNLLMAVLWKREFPHQVGEVPVPVLSYRFGHLRPTARGQFGQALLFAWELMRLRTSLWLERFRLSSHSLRALRSGAH